jgi:Ferritin-like domain
MMASIGEARTRRQLLVAGVSASTAAAALLAPAAAPASSSSLSSQPDTDRLRRLLSVELLLLFSYQSILDSSVLAPRARRALAPLRAHEEAHIRVLRFQLDARGGTAPPPPASIAAADHDLARRNVAGRLGQLRGARDALQLLLALERVTVGAYFVALTKLQDRQLIVLACEIMANDAQHEAILGEQLHPGDAANAVPYGLVQGVQGR